MSVLAQLIFGITLVVAGAIPLRETLARPETDKTSAGITAYNDAMQILQDMPPYRHNERAAYPRRDFDNYDANLKKVNVLFRKASRLGVAQADVGMACLIYDTRTVARYGEAFRHVQKAAQHNLLEAKALLISYSTFGIGTPRDPKRGDELQQQLGQFVENSRWPLLNGNPGSGTTVATKNDALILIFDTFTSTRCAPWLDVNPAWIPPPTLPALRLPIQPFQLLSK